LEGAGGEQSKGLLTLESAHSSLRANGRREDSLVLVAVEIAVEFKAAALSVSRATARKIKKLTWNLALSPP
jgi:hypothetical protein